MSIAALNTYLKPLEKLFAEEGIQEISINAPGEAWVEKFGDMRYEPLPEFTLEHLQSLGHLIAQSTSQAISAEKPLLSATLPGGYRIQIVFPPAVEGKSIAMSIRKQATLQLTLDDYQKMGAFDRTLTGVAPENPADKELAELYAKGDVKQFIIRAVQHKKNIIISGGTSTGKTTFLNAALRALPPEERIITVEDAREVKIENIPNRVHLLASKGGQGLAKVTTQDLIEACLRLRPDRIIVGELRGAEAFSYLRAINTGHPGSIASLHADSPQLAMEQLILMIMQADLGITRDQIKAYVENVIQVIIQLKRGEKGRRYVSEIYFKPGH
ncbi:MAG: P-type DNA transfer ATPase VirB11 [Alphaproteobacteria bacterium]|jgi:type IV secretion system protein VirB11|nr:P-type DNA transfer ATPase VirB11 [Rickettsiales bacterium]